MKLPKRIMVKEVSTKAARRTAVIEHLHCICFPKDEIGDLTLGYWWIMYCGTQPVGFCGMERSENWCNAGYLCRAGVIPSERGHGLQKRLLQVRIQKARKLGWDWLITDTTDNPASANNLIAKGFKLYNPSEPWGYKNTLYWRLNTNRIADK